MSKKIINFEAIEEASFILEEINKFRKKIVQLPNPRGVGIDRE